VEFPFSIFSATLVAKQECYLRNKSLINMGNAFSPRYLSGKRLGHYIIQPVSLTQYIELGREKYFT